MKKLTLFVMLLLFAAANAGAQEKKKAFDSSISKHPVVFGIRGGINFNEFGPDITKVWDTALKKKSENGWNIGLIVDCPILGSLHFQPGIFYKTKGFKLAESEVDFTRQVHGSAQYLEFPLLLSYRYNVKRGLQLEFNVGPYIGTGLKGTVSDYTYPKGQQTGTVHPGLAPDLATGEDPIIVRRDFFGDDLDDSFGIKKSDMGLCLGIGMTVNRFYIGFQYDWGLKNLCNEVCWGSKYRFRNSSATILIGFNINKN